MKEGRGRRRKRIEEHNMEKEERGWRERQVGEGEDTPKRQRKQGREDKMSNLSVENTSLAVKNT